MSSTNKILIQANTILPNQHELNLLLAHVLGCSYETILADIPTELSAIQAEKFLILTKKRAAGYPLAYLLESQPFCGLDFFVNEHVLIPRPETEVLVDIIIKKICHSGTEQSGAIESMDPIAPTKASGLQDDKPKQKLLIADIGTGSGAMAISLAKALPNIRVIATDTSSDALAVAQKNAGAHFVTDQITFLHGNLLEPIKKAGLTPTIIVANLPYLPAQEILTPTTNGNFVSAEEWQTIKHEPQSALSGGERGDELIRECLQQATAFSPTPQALFFEADPLQLSNLQPFAQKLFPHHQVQIFKDLSHQDRFLTVTK